MELLIDTYNVLHTTGVLPPELAGPDVPGLADLLAKSRWRGSPVVLVCDGTPPSGSRRVPQRLSGGVRVVYSGPHRSADDLIEAFVAASTAPGRLLVVSSDRRIQRAGKRRGCRILDSHTFLIRLSGDVQSAAASVPPTPSLPAKSAKEWADDLGVPLNADPLDVVDLDALPPLPPQREGSKSPTPNRAHTPPPSPPPPTRRQEPRIPPEVISEAMAAASADRTPDPPPVIPSERSSEEEASVPDPPTPPSSGSSPENLTGYAIPPDIIAQAQRLAEEEDR